MAVSDIVARARVSRTTFYQQFDDRRACLLAAYEDAQRRLWVQAKEATEPEPDWPAEAAAAIAAVLGFFASEPATAHLFSEAGQVADRELAERHRTAMQRLASLLRRGRANLRQPDQLAEITETALIENAAAIARSYVVRGEANRLPALAPQLIELLLSPYLGAAEAGRLAGRQAS